MALLFRRNLAGRVPFFVALLAFYLARGLLIAVVAGRLSRESHLVLETCFALADAALQICFAAALFVHISQSGDTAGGRVLTPVRLLPLPTSMGVASLCTAALAWAMHAYSPVPVDRGVLLCGFLFLSLFLLTCRREQPHMERLLLRDFAFVSAVAIASQVGRSIAASQREPRFYLFWVYGNAIVWLVMLGVWTLRFRHIDRTHARAVAPAAAVAQRL